jgi:hypothetical protein
MRRVWMIFIDVVEREERVAGGKGQQQSSFQVPTGLKMILHAGQGAVTEHE